MRFSWHLSAGLAVVFLSDPVAVQALPKPPQYIFDTCTQQNLPISGNAAGHDSPDDLTGLTVGPFLQNNGWHGRGIGAMFGYVFFFSSSSSTSRVFSSPTSRVFSSPYGVESSTNTDE